MSSVLVLPQRDAVHLACDAAVYNGATGILEQVNASKCTAMPTLHAAISMTGPSENDRLFSELLVKRFSCFDELVAGAEEVLPAFFQECSEEHREGDSSSALYLVGWHEKDDRPGAYSMHLASDGFTRMDELLANSADEAVAGWQARLGKLVKQSDDISGEPLPSGAALDSAGFVVRDDLETYQPEIDLLHLMEIQRHTRYRERSWIGGKCVLTTVGRDHITQRVLHHWAEDEVGETIEPRPIDWAAWRAERERTFFASNAPPGMSRLKREMLEKKLRKGTLRAV